MNNTRKVSLPEDLCQAAEKKFAQRFGSLDELLTAVLSRLVCDDAVLMDEREQRIIEERLKGLGYV